MFRPLGYGWSKETVDFLRVDWRQKALEWETLRLAPPLFWPKLSTHVIPATPTYLPLVPPLP